MEKGAGKRVVHAGKETFSGPGVNLAGPTHALIAGKTLFLASSLKVFQEEISIGLGSLNDEEVWSPVPWASPLH